MTSQLPTIAVLGGTGAEGSGLAFRWARAGYKVIIGSRDAARAEEAAAAVGEAGMSGADNETAARACDIAVLTVPFAAQRDTLAQVRAELKGKILIDVTVPLAPPRVSRVQLPAEGSAAQLAQSTLGDGVKVVSAFQSVSAHHLKDPDYKIDCDVLVCGDEKEAREATITLADAAGMTGIHAGPLANAAASEALTSVLIWINRRYKVPSAGIRITGLDD
ncbi:MAG: NADPH-dependent F420 reductase [Pseudomonadota bacterium]|nr:NADPH-dependent F420 reductase [Pseudomonadota bacterium]